MTDRRAWFFLGVAVVVIAIQPLVPEYRWTTLSVSLIYLAFALLFATANISAKRTARRNGHL